MNGSILFLEWFDGPTLGLNTVATPINCQKLHLESLPIAIKT